MTFATMGRRHILIVAVLGVTLVAGVLWLYSLWIWRGFIEYRMSRSP